MKSLKNLTVAMVCIGLAISSAAQTGTPSQTPVAPRHSRHRRSSSARPSSPSSPSTSEASGPPDETPAQRAADQRLLKTQQAQSAHAAKVNDQVVQQAVAQRQKVQNEVRIQDAPGPAQTGAVPGAGSPSAPVNAGDRIQDAPGPAQTLPALPVTQQPAALPAATPGQTAQPASQPATDQPQPAATTTQPQRQER